MSLTIDSMIRWWGREEPERDALCLSGERLNYADLDKWVGNVAARFADLGLQVGDRVCISGVTSLPWIVAKLATLRCGGVVAGLTFNLVAAEFAWLLGDYAPRLLVCDADVNERLADIGPLADRHGNPTPDPIRIDMDEIRALRSAPQRDVMREVDPDAVAVIITTSGSTARPKGVMFSNHTLFDHIASFALEEPFEAKFLTIIVCAPFTSTAGGMVVLNSLIKGGTAFLQAKFDPQETLETIVRERVIQFAGAPIFMQRLADLPDFADADISSIEISITGGATVVPELLKKYADKGVLVRQMYSQSEAGGWGVSNPRRYAISRPERCGYAGLNRQIAIIDADGKRLGPGEIGQIIMRGPGQMLGYWNDPEATARTVVDGWLQTGDLGELDEDGLLRFVDRIKDIIISGGLNISAAEVERAILEIPGVEEASVLAAPDDKFGETPMAIVYAPGGLTPAAVVEHCNGQLSAFKVPRYVVIADEPLPRLAAGKISKPLLRERYLKEQPLPERVR